MRKSRKFLNYEFNEFNELFKNNSNREALLQRRQPTKRKHGNREALLPSEATKRKHGK